MIRIIIILCFLSMLSGCMGMFGQPTVYGEIPNCDKLVPPSLIAPVEGVEIPTFEKWQDGHEKAEPWILGYLGQTGQLDKANDKPPAVDHIYRNCLEENRKALARSRRGFFARLFS